MSDDAPYTLIATRKARFTDLMDLVKPAQELASAIEAEGPRFKLFSYSPARQLYPLQDGGQSNVEKFVMTSDIEWNFGREPQDPTYELIFFGDEESREVMLKVQFVLEADEGTFPGLVAELFIAAEALGDVPADHGPRLDRLLAAMKKAFAADDGRIRLPDDPENE